MGMDVKQVLLNQLRVGVLDALLAIPDHEATIGGLSMLLKTSTSNVVRAADVLEAHGFVRRRVEGKHTHLSLIEPDADLLARAARHSGKFAAKGYSAERIARGLRAIKLVVDAATVQSWIAEDEIDGSTLN